MRTGSARVASRTFRTFRTARFKVRVIQLIAGAFGRVALVCRQPQIIFTKEPDMTGGQWIKAAKE